MSTTRAGRLLGRSAPSEQPSVWSAVRRYRVSLAGISVASFGVGVVEAAVLIAVVRAALAIAAGETHVALGLGADGFQPTVEAVLLIVVGLAVVRFALEATSGALMARAAADVLNDRRPALLRSYLRAPWEAQSVMEHGHLLDLMGRHVAQVQALVHNVANTTSSALSFAALLVSSVAAAPLTAVAIVVTAACLFAVMRPITSLIRRASQRRVDAGRAYAATASELLPLTVELRTFRAEKAAADYVDRLTAAEAEPARRTMLLSHVSGAAYRSIVLAILAAGLLVVTNANLDVADVGASALILLRGLNYSQVLQSAHQRLADLRPFLHSLEREAAELRAVETDPEAGETLSTFDALDFDRVGYEYPGGRRALTDISLRLERGDTLGVIGPSGGGKSTLLQLLLGLRQPTEGEIAVNHRPRGVWSARSWYGLVGYVPQEPRLFSGTVAENIRFYRADVSDAEVEHAARRARIHDEIVAWPDGYETRVGPRGSAVSGGQRQRIALARALVGAPHLLVLDEPTSALDLQSEALVQDTLTELSEELTLVIVAHRMSTVNICDRIVVLLGGRVQDIGRREDLERNSHFYRDALRLSQIT